MGVDALCTNKKLHQGTGLKVSMGTLTRAASKQAAGSAAEPGGPSWSCPWGSGVHTSMRHDALQAEAAGPPWVVLRQRGVVCIIISFIFLQGIKWYYQCDGHSFTCWLVLWIYIYVRPSLRHHLLHLPAGHQTLLSVANAAVQSCVLACILHLHMCKA